jgi:hypothetical protein
VADQRHVVRVEVAIYGATGNAHGLIASSLGKESLPVDLAGIVDRPPHHPEDALPLLACARVDPFFAVWQTLDDPRAPRRGMVRSYVALIDLELMGELTNLAEVTKRLPHELADDSFSEAFEIEESDPIPPKLGPRYESLCEHLVKSDRQKPVILPNEGDWAELLSTLWWYLWPEARGRLACLHAAGPESEPSTTTTILVTPASAINKWAGYPIVDRTAVRTDAARVLCGETSPAFANLRRELGALPSDLRMIGLMESAAVILKRSDDALATTIELKMLLEAVIRLAPASTAGTHLKMRIVDRLAESIKRSAVSDILSLSNLSVGTSGVSLSGLARAVRAWVTQHVASSEPHHASTIIRRLADSRFAAWWREAVREGLLPVIATASVSVWETIWTWVAHRPAVMTELLQEVALPEGAEVLIARACPRSLTAPLAEAALALARSRGWPRLHGSVVAAIATPRQAYEQQIAFSTRPREGLTALLERLDGSEIVDLAVTFDDDELRRRAISAVVAAPGLLTDLDVTKPVWRDIWRRAIDSGLPLWAGIRDPGRVAQQLVNQVAEGDPIDEELILALGGTLPRLPDGLPSSFWERATPPVRDAIARALAFQWLAAIGDAALPAAPDSQVLAAILDVFAEQLSTRSFRLDLLPIILDNTGQPAFMERLLGGQAIALPTSVARELGLRIAKWSDATLASTAFKRWRRGWDDLQPLLIECTSLLDRWDRWKLPTSQRPSADDVRSLLIELRQIGCELYPEGPPDHLWEDAGGKAWAMFRGSTGAENWTQAVSLIERGASGAPRARRLIQELRRAFSNSPNEERLSILERWLEDR